jgi:hypothetical protein
MLEPENAAPNPIKWGPWLNLPCPDDLREIADACPHGWVELTVNQGMSYGDPGNPPEGFQDIQADRYWGIDAAVAANINDLIEELCEGGEVSKIPHGCFGLLCRVTYEPGSADSFGTYGLEVGWGADSQPVFNLPPDVKVDRQ